MPRRRPSIGLPPTKRHTYASKLPNSRWIARKAFALLTVDSIFARDYPVVQGCLLFTAVIYVVVNLIVDLCYPLFDPRVTVA